MQKKYIELLLKRCLCIEEGTPLFIHYNKLNKDFVNALVEYAKNMGITDIYLDEEDSEYLHDLLNKLSLEEIENHEAFNCKCWDEYAKKGAAFLMLDTTIPKLMEDIDSEKIAKSSFVRRKTKPVYKEKQLKSLIPWCIAALPNEEWAKDLFPKSDNKLEEFWNTIADICMLNSDNPIENWNNLLEKQKKTIKYLNELEIKKLYYKNELGTDFEIELSEKALWKGACTGKWIVNLPSYEVFTTPDYKTANGIVYSSMPLLYNGKEIKDFYLEFKNGKVTNFDAKEGKDILKEIINSDELSSYLGEVALVNYDSPISKTNLIFKNTLFDENASCHLALGSGFIECIKDSKNLEQEELEKLGVNFSKNHVDFMIGTKDLIIEADTNKGKITIMKDGNLVIN